MSLPLSISGGCEHACCDQNGHACCRIMANHYERLITMAQSVVKQIKRISIDDFECQMAVRSLQSVIDERLSPQ